MSENPDRRLKKWLAARLAHVLRRPRLSPEQLRALPARRVLIVRQHNQMGDMICATPALRAIREAFGAAEIALVTAPVNYEVVRDNPDLDRVFLFEQRLWRRPHRLLSFVRALRGFRPDVAFVLNSVSFSVTSAMIAYASGARFVVGGDSRPFGWDVSRHAYSLEMPSELVVQGPAVAHSLAPLAAIGIATADHTTVVVASEDERATARQLLTALHLGDRFWALHPGAGKPANVWPAERFAAVADQAAAAGHDVLVLHGPADGDAVACLQAALAPTSHLRVRIAPRLTVGAVVALLEHADRLLCNDTGIMHIAGALRLPTVALFGPTDPAVWKPPADEVVALRAAARQEDPRGQEFGWLEAITVQEVWQTLAGLPVGGSQLPSRSAHTR